MDKPLFELKRYRTATGRIPFNDWICGLDNRTAARIEIYAARMRGGNFGDSKAIGNGVSELRINVGPGFRLYYLKDGMSVVVLLLGGDKSSQAADIAIAQDYAADYWSRR